MPTANMSLINILEAQAVLCLYRHLEKVGCLPAHAPADVHPGVCLKSLVLRLVAPAQGPQRPARPTGLGSAI